MAILLPRNDALSVHPPAGDQYLTTNGSNWLFTATTIFGVFALALTALHITTRSKKDLIFHHLFTLASLTGLIAYYAMASDLAFSLIVQSNQLSRSGTTRQIFWPKYVLWTVSFPTLTLTLGLLANRPWATMLFHTALAHVWIIAFLVGAYTPSNYKWGFFAFGLVAYFLLAVSTLHTPFIATNRKGVKRDYLALAGWTNLLWVQYPLAWGLTDGGNYLGVTGGAVWFGVLDVLLVVGTGAAVIFVLAKRWDFGALGISFTRGGRVPVAAGAATDAEAGDGRFNNDKDGSEVPVASGAAPI